jgi:hypothetical protein
MSRGRPTTRRDAAVRHPRARGCRSREMRTPVVARSLRHPCHGQLRAFRSFPGGGCRGDSHRVHGITSTEFS